MVSITKGQDWDLLVAENYEDIKFLIALDMAWQTFIKDWEKSTNTVFDKDKIKEIGDNVNQLIFQIPKLSSEEIIKRQDAYENMQVSSVSVAQLFMIYWAEYKNLITEITQQKSFKDKIGEEIFKLHVNLPLTNKPKNSTEVAKNVFEYLKPFVEQGEVTLAKAYSGLINGQIDLQNMDDRFKDSAQITIYLKKDIDANKLLDLTKEINEIANRAGIHAAKTPEGDSHIKGIVSLRCDYYDGRYIPANEVSQKQLTEQENMPVLKFLRTELKAKEVKELKDSLGFRLFPVNNQQSSDKKIDHAHSAEQSFKKK